jgi:hypothetical protein
VVAVSFDTESDSVSVSDDYDRLARAVTAHLDCARLWQLTGLRPPRVWPR